MSRLLEVHGTFSADYNCTYSLSRTIFGYFRGLYGVVLCAVVTLGLRV